MNCRLIKKFTNLVQLRQKVQLQDKKEILPLFTTPEYFKCLQRLFIRDLLRFLLVVIIHFFTPIQKLQLVRLCAITTPLVCLWSSGKETRNISFTGLFSSGGFYMYVRSPLCQSIFRGESASFHSNELKKSFHLNEIEKIVIYVTRPRSQKLTMG